MSPVFNVFMMALPARVKGLTVLNSDLSYSIFINDDLSPSAKRETLRHELRHISQDDFSQYDVQVVESFAHYGDMW